MHLPPATTANVAPPASAGSTSAAANVNPAQSCSLLLPQRADPAAFTCEDCELEIRSRAKLRRHRRYYCPFRENIFADPVKDAVDLYRTQQQQQGHRQRYGSVSSSCDSDEVDFAEEDTHNGDGDRTSSVDGRLGRCSRATSVPLALTEGEWYYLSHVAERSGLKFVEDAYASDVSADDGLHGGMFSDTSSSSTPSRSPYRVTVAPLARRHPRSPARVRGRLPSPKRTPLHGLLPSPSPSPKGRVLRSSQTTASASLLVLPNTSPLTCHTGGVNRLLNVGSGTPKGESIAAEDAKGDDEDDMIGAWPPADLRHLHHHRRGSGHRRERHILQKRLRAQEGALMALATDSPHRQPRKPRVARGGAPRCGSDAAVGEAEATRLHVTPSADFAHPSTSTAAAAYSYTGPSQSLLTPQVVAQAESLLVLNWSRPRRGKDGAANAFVCPYCADYTTLASQRGLRAHAMRVHAKEVAKARVRVVETEAAPVEEGRGHESEEGKASP
ncbi:conserved hypothetical protein [Leishmania major strain Friedlin]|uniref:Uncharacterized protein n=1 Tax=Leishmania major TaxID=5664 RepID=Q4Q911_LEIMA|nr:conserved hypothetical protein [Leishmania major strain Friedlin]CAG9576506.1 UTP10/Nucleolar_protein_287 [Leishmania major strain Friedlin]CAJ05441.1 conserved hypothetical protein [Leishmania major strain Friedlin]|eukprot:XP_001684187.1 conserved hypothetical protein [Leishmania major strain Friedlin]